MPLNKYDRLPTVLSISRPRTLRAMFHNTRIVFFLFLLAGSTFARLTPRTRSGYVLSCIFISRCGYLISWIRAYGRSEPEELPKSKEINGNNYDLEELLKTNQDADTQNIVGGFRVPDKPESRVPAILKTISKGARDDIDKEIKYLKTVSAVSLGRNKINHSTGRATSIRQGLGEDFHCYTEGVGQWSYVEAIS